MVEMSEVLRGLAARGDVAVLGIVVSAQRGAAKVGAKLVLDSGGTRRAGDAAFSEAALARIGALAREVAASGEPRTVEIDDEGCGARFSLYLEPQSTGPELLLLGKGPVVEALERLGAAVGMGVKTVGRDGFARLAPPTRRSHVVVATGHDGDEDALVAALAGDPRSVQLVASSRRVPTVLAALRAKGVSEERLALVRSPAGLDLGSEGPDEIAIAILAELVLLRRGGTGRPLVEVKGGAAPAKASPVAEVRREAAKRPKFQPSPEDQPRPEGEGFANEDFRADDGSGSRADAPPEDEEPRAKPAPAPAKTAKTRADEADEVPAGERFTNTGRFEALRDDEGGSAGEPTPAPAKPSQPAASDEDDFR